MAGLKEALRRGSSTYVFLAQPVIHVTRVGANDSVWERPVGLRTLNCRCDMHMCEIDLVHLLRPIARGYKIAKQFACVRPQ
ncbi:hypothetical protein EV128_12367 [Rhizobium azibense]|nr:hypothetical protein EV128_12367 [Rhizobium azibense]